MSLKLRIVRCLDVTVMEFSGRVTLGEGSVVMRDAVSEALWNGHRKLALDYGDITYQDSSGFGELVASFTIARNSGAELVLFDLTQMVQRLFQITKLYTLFPVYNSRESALTHFDSTRNPEIKLSEHRFFDVAVFGIEGSLTQQSGASKVLEATQRALSSSAESVILMCPQILDIDRAGAETLLEANREVRERGGALVLAGVEDRLNPAMSDTGVFPELPMYETVDTALKIFGLAVARGGRQYGVVRAR